jgi:DNA invertase Pin-like site-specific DNA recombinase
MRKRAPHPEQRRVEVRCAVYTRKSSEEGLEQEFNSLHAQREACLAYVQSQRHEGWKALPALYDDGGISGGTLDRPALARLLDNIRARQVDLVVIYKVDRLTRSLSDFAKLVEVFNSHNVSFVSVTQQFNTATSMGRLTLNMLLSFAQFEREVTGERIRDKIAASKRKGMWMGGNAPLGYDVADRKLVVNRAEARDVLEIFQAYLKLGSVRALMLHLATLGIMTKRREHAGGKLIGGRPFSRGNLYDMLQNPTYRGKVEHMGHVHEGEHVAIVEEELWAPVQAKLAEHRVERAPGAGGRPSLLAGLLVDEAGHRLSPSHSKKGPRRYRYYVSQGLITSAKADDVGGMRLPAGEVERLVINAIRHIISTPLKLLELAGNRPPDAAAQKQLLNAASTMMRNFDTLDALRIASLVRRTVARITVKPSEIRVELMPQRLVDLILDRHVPRDATATLPECHAHHVVVLPMALKRVGNEMRLIVGDTSAPQEADPALQKLLAQSQKFRAQLFHANDRDVSSLAGDEKISGAHFTRVLRLGFLAPDIVAAIAAGQQPEGLTATKLMADTRLPLAWDKQRSLLGFPQRDTSPASPA